jgi:hypothetical protein
MLTTAELERYIDSSIKELFQSCSSQSCVGQQLHLVPRSKFSLAIQTGIGALFPQATTVAWNETSMPGKQNNNKKTSSLQEMNKKKKKKKRSSSVSEDVCLENF